MDDDEIECEECGDEGSYPWSWKGALVDCGMFITAVLQHAATLTGSLTNSLGASFNRDVDIDMFRDSVAHDLETIDNQEE